MPFDFHGFGTINYGARDFQPNGSYITTQWATICYIPVLPLKSIRIIQTGFLGYQVLEDVGLNRRQVLSVYGWFASILAADITLIEVPHNSQVEIPVLFLFYVLLAVPWFLRRRASNRALQEYERMRMGRSNTNIG
jgi:hypothetical protein